MNADKPDEGKGIALLNIPLEKQERTPEGEYFPESLWDSRGFLKRTRKHRS